MIRNEIKSMLAGVGMAGLIASVSLSTSGCQKESGSAGQESESGMKTEAKASCGEGAAVDSAKASCGQDSCGQEAKKDDDKGSCGQGSCGQK